ncbi:hypothetical protein [Cognatilysobacter terrigena]|uniref:hypothetical protein n=1 Tax=Cognatilysobacter terrigena TaxID=2488749 RepID=UPI001060A440|nr:hypothetical protein [Lysobacter terrigena]
MRDPLIMTALAVALVLPAVSFAQEDDDERGAMIEMMTSSDGLPQANMGEEDNGWLLSQDKGVCRMYSFNDPLALQVDPAHPETTGMHFQVIDGTIPGAAGTQIPVVLAMRDKEDAQFGGYQGVAVVAKGMVPAYVVPMPIKDLVEKFPNGFQVMLMDAKGEKKIMQSDTVGSRKHMATLGKCATP